MCKLKARSWKIVKGHGECQECFSTDLDTLTWHHRDPATKSFTPAGLTCKTGVDEFDHKRYDQVAEEVAKCDLLCRTCHDDEHGIYPKPKPRRDFSFHYLKDITIGLGFKAPKHFYSY